MSSYIKTLNLIIFTSLLLITSLFLLPQAVVNASSFTFNNNLKIGTTYKADTKELQNFLNQEGYNCGTVDGLFGNKTKVAVILFQSASGLTPDGSVGPITRGYINRMVSLLPDDDTNPTPDPTPLIDRTLKLGMTGDDVSTLQTYLNNHGYDVGTADGKFGLKTQAKVILFQVNNGLSADGLVGNATRNIINNGSSTNTCSNGATNYPTCTIVHTCTNQALNYPTCDIFTPCTNGATNPPLCTTITLDTTKPVITTFSIPSTNQSYVVPINSLVATDNIGVKDYNITESNIIPTTGWSITKPVSYVFTSIGEKHLYAWARDNALNVSTSVSKSVIISSVSNICLNGATNYPTCTTFTPCTNNATNPPLCTTIIDTTKPVISSFSIPTTAVSLTVAVSTFTATDNIAITGYKLTETNVIPTSGWSSTKPTYYTFSSEGTNKYLYAWVKDASGNISLPFSDTVSITLPDTAKPVISSFSIPTTAVSLTVAVSTFTASDNIAITGYKLTETNVIPTSGWSSIKPTTYTFSSEGTNKYLYAWTKDAIGNVSLPFYDVISITLPDVTKPVVTFTIPSATSTSLNVPVTFTATDNKAVTGYLITETNVTPTSGWLTTPPTSYTFVSGTANGLKTLYAWAKDAASNVSTPVSKTVTINVADTTKPVISSFSIPSTSTTLSVTINSFTATDNIGVTGYKLTETNVAPTSGWLTTPPSSYTFSTEGTNKYLYAWAKDASGNISLPSSDTVSITLPVVNTPSLSVDYLNTFDANAGSNDYFNITSNVSWNVSTYPLWVTLSKTSGTGNSQITVTVNANTGAQRTGTITLTGTGVSSVSLSVVQLSGTTNTCPNGATNYPTCTLPGNSLIMESVNTNNTTTGSWTGVNIPRNTATALIYRNNLITSANYSGYMLQAGDEDVLSTNNKLDGEIISGNKFVWNGTIWNGVEQSITHGIFTGYQKNAVIKYNYLQDVPMGIIRKSNGMTNTSGGIAYNIINRTNAVAVVVKGMNGVNIYNNTFYSDETMYSTPDSGTWRGIVDIYANDNPSATSATTKIKNNIFYTKYQIYNITVESGSETGFESDYNVFYCESGTPIFNYLGARKTFAQWQALGFDTHSVVVNPNFINTASFVPSSRLNYGTNLGVDWQTGLASNATWTVGQSPATANQDNTWQVGARILTSNVPNAPTVTVSASPSSVTSGNSSTISWSSTNATSCNSGGHGTGTTGSFSTGSLTASQSYSVSCTGAGGTTSNSTSVTVASTPPSGTAYYVSPSGSDSNSGTINSPWFTLEKAWKTVAGPGVTIYMRGGTYNYSSSQNLTGKNGSSGNLIKVWAYPGEKPVITRTSSWSYSNYRAGIYFSGNYAHFKGIKITGFKQDDSYVWTAMRGENFNNCIFEQIDFSYSGLGSYMTGSCSNNLFLNSDWHDNYDPITGGVSGSKYENADGLNFENVTGTGNVIRGCRAWNNADDGFDLFNNDSDVLLDKCWAWGNGYTDYKYTTIGGDGNGFKLGPTMKNTSAVLKTVQNSISFDNASWGFQENLSNSSNSNMALYNNTSFSNGASGRWGGGFHFLVPGKAYYIKNNISYKDVPNAEELDLDTNISNNSWDLGVTLSDSDFLSVSPVGTDGPRQDDGSLPNLNFLKLASSSDLIDKGTNVGLSYVTKPDLGAYEYGSVLGASTHNFTQTLKYGSTGNEVKELQKVLIQGGYLKKGNVDGNYGILTLNAMKAYQKDLGLTPDGIVGLKTREMLNK